MKKNIKYTGILALTAYIINNLQTNTRRVSNTVFKNNNRQIVLNDNISVNGFIDTSYRFIDSSYSEIAVDELYGGAITINPGDSISLTVYSDCAFKPEGDIGYGTLGSWTIVGKSGNIYGPVGDLNYFSSPTGEFQVSFKPGETVYGTLVIFSLASRKEEPQLFELTVIVPGIINTRYDITIVPT